LSARRFDLDCAAPREKFDTVIKLTERYCVVLQTLRNSPQVTVTTELSAA
jgi:uncharacterized OsmC-like protein